MTSVLAYLRPTTLDEAASLLAAPGRRAIGGGTVVVPDARVQRDEGVELVDLQGLGLDRLAVDGDRVRIEAMVRVADLVGHTDVPPLIHDLARAELPSALRNQATVGGTVALANAESVLLAGLLAFGAIVECHGHDPVPLAQLLAAGVGNRLITAFTIERTGPAGWASTGRTPRDTPIVAAIARPGTVALTGVASTPILVDPADPTAGLDPPADFRGSSSYRRELAAILTRRALEGLSS